MCSNTCTSLPLSRVFCASVFVSLRLGVRLSVCNPVLVESRSDTDLQIVRPTWFKTDRTIKLLVSEALFAFLLSFPPALLNSFIG